MESSEQDLETDPSESVSRPTRLLLQLFGRTCCRCVQSCSAYEIIWNLALGFKDNPRCMTCLSKGLGRPIADIRVQLNEYIQRNECFRKAWQEAMHLEGHVDCPAGVEAASETVWDAGNMACGELVLTLRGKLKALPPGSELCVIATDPAAPEDIPSWCRLTGHPLLKAEHPRYLIRRKEA